MVYKKARHAMISPMLPSVMRPSFLDTPLIYGCMNICGTFREPKSDPHERILAAYETGYRVFDHADIYSGGACETAFGRALREKPTMRHDTFVITKAGHQFPAKGSDIPHHYNTDPEHLRTAILQSRERLGVETIDLFLIHRFDPLLDPLAVGELFTQLQEEGVVKHFGVSNYLPWQMEALRCNMTTPLVANQVAFHPGRLDPMFDGTLDHALAHRMAPLLWGAVGRGLFATGGMVPEAHAEQERMIRIQQALDAIGEKEGLTRTQTTLAWLRRHPSRPIPVLGTTQPNRMKEAWERRDAKMDRIDWFRILIASRGERMP